MVTKIKTFVLIFSLALSCLFILPSAKAQLPIRTGVIEQFCLSRYSYSQKLQEICRIRQSEAVEEFMGLQKKAPLQSNARAKLEDCLEQYYSEGNGYDWIAVVRCAK